MAGKRKHEESEPQEAVHESRQFQVYGSKPAAPKKPRKTLPTEHQKQAHASSVNTIKKRIRDVSRRLERAEDLPANIRIEDERALAAYQQDLEAAELEKIRQKMIKKYHMVRFFERQKATRTLNKLRKQLLASKSEEEVETLKKRMHVAEVDLNYTQYCPLSEVYVGLYPQKKPEEAADVPKPPMWAEVEKRMEAGTLHKLRNRANTSGVSKPRTLEIRPAKKIAKAIPEPDMSGLNRRERRSKGRIQDEGRKKHKSTGFEKNELFGASQSFQRNTNDGDESDGGFFEG